MRKRKLIINADDYGLDRKFNRGIIELVKKGIVTSVSVMVNKKYVYPKEVASLKNISIGLHLELKEKDTANSTEKQVRKFKKIFNQEPSHLDGHKHCHITQANIKSVIKIAKKYNLPVRSRLREDRKILKTNCIKTPGLFLGWHPKRKEVLFKRLKEDKSSIAELVCHPGYYSVANTSSYNRQRQAEFKILKSRTFRQLLGRFTLINYNEF
jgi:chitin disaccharide deacetylase